MSDNTYFAAKESDKTATILLNKANLWFNEIRMNGYLDKIRDMWAAYHGAYYTSFDSSHKITFGGEQGELVNLSVNHLRNLAQHMLTMITATRPAFQARSTNNDYKSLVQTKLANGLLDYYMREKRLEKFLKKAVEYSIVMGAGFVKMEWNATTGEIYDYIDQEKDPVTGKIIKEGYPVYEGDVEFTNLSPFDVVFDDNLPDINEAKWVLCRSFKNRHDLMAKYPELADKINSLKTIDDIYKFGYYNYVYSSTDLMPIYEFYHLKTESMPDGRYMMFLAEDVVLSDGPIPYRGLPVYRIAPSDILGTPYGYTPLFDIMPIQDSINSLYSTILTNQSTFGVQNIGIPEGSNISISQLEGGMNLITYNAQLGEPKPLNFTQTPQEIFSFLQLLERASETISGINSVTRGNPESSLKSGNALALVQSMSLQFMSGLQQSYVQLIEDIGTGLINMLRDFASVPRIAMIVGKDQRSEMKEFKGDDLSSVNRVLVDFGNPLSKCLGKDTPVLLHDGSIKMVQDIDVTDKLMGHDSKPRTIESLASGQEMMYEVSSKDPKRNVKYTCNESHILTLKYCSNDERYGVKKGDVIDISIKEYLRLSYRQQRLLQGFTTGVDFDKKEVVVPPYILGAWLGDGHSATAALTTMDSEILNEWTNYANSIGMQIRKSTNDNCGKANIYFITSGQQHGPSDRNPFMNELREMEVLNNKHIPNIYLRNDRQTRLELLAGLLDTDGTLVDETFVFTQVNDKLTENVIYLAKSLGFRVTNRKIKTQGGPNCRDYKGITNKITIDGNTWEIPTRLKRKQAKVKTKSRDWLNYGIQVKPIGVDTYYGFTLKEEPHFLLGDFTVTHNTTAGRVSMAEQMLQMGLIKTPEQYFMVINTGRLETMTEDTTSELLLIRAENERLVSDNPVIAVATDQHTLHIKEHRTVLSDPALRFDAELSKRVYDHIQEHIDLLRQTDPNLLKLIGEQPLPPIGGNPISEQNPEAIPQANGELPQEMQNTQAQSVSTQNIVDTQNTNLPRPPAPFENLPVTAGENIPQG